MISLMEMLLPSLLSWEVQPILQISNPSHLSLRFLSRATNPQLPYRFLATAHPHSLTHRPLQLVACSSFRAKTSSLSSLSWTLPTSLMTLKRRRTLKRSMRAETSQKRESTRSSYRLLISQPNNRRSLIKWVTSRKTTSSCNSNSRTP